MYKNRENINIKDLCNKLFYSNWYFLFLAIVTFTFWITNLSIISISILLLTGCIILLTNRDVLAVAPIPILMIITVYNNNFLLNKTNVIVASIFVILLFFAIIFNIFYYKQHFSKGELTYPLIFVSIALLMGGVGSKYISSYTNGVVFAISLGVVMLLLYTFFLNCINVTNRQFLINYFCKIMVLVAIIVSMQLVVAHSYISGGFEFHLRAELNVGWANRSGIGVILVLTLPFSFYLADDLKKHNLIAFLLCFSFYISCFFTFSRGAMIFSSIELVSIVLYFLIKGQHQKDFVIANSIFLFIVTVVIFCTTPLVKLFLTKFFEIGLNGSGRKELYIEAIDLFNNNKFFGVGLGYIGKNFVVKNNCIYWFHSTILQILASLGMFGLVCYSYLYYKRFILFDNDKFSIILLFSMVYFELHNLIDSATFEPFPYFYMVIFENAVLERVFILKNQINI